MTQVIYYTTIFEESPAKNFINSLSSVQKNKVSRIIGYIELYSLTVVIPHVKKLAGTSLCEIRILGQDNIRVFYATIERDAVIILHGFIKKSQKTPVREINTALNRLNEWMNRKGRA